MKITYTGRQVELKPAQFKKLEAQFAKIGKLLDGKHPSDAHVVLSLERHLHHAEVNVNYHNHALVGLGSDVDLFTAIHAASEKLEKQLLKTRAKWRDSKRTPRKGEVEAAPVAAAEPEPQAETEPRIFRVNHHQRGKPMTVEEAILEMERNVPYLVYLNAETDRVNVLLRRVDGDFDLVEA